MKPVLRIPVRALVEQMLRSGDLALDSWAPNRKLDGLRAHQRIQKSRPEEYTQEVPLSYRIEKVDVVLEVAGRIDGIYVYPDRVIVDEIKTTTGSLERLCQVQDPAHWGQAKIYAFIYAKQNGLDTIDVQLTYHHLDSGETREIQSTFTAAQLESFFFEVIERYYAWIERVETWRHERNESIRSLTFPYPFYRPGQRQMAVDVFRTLKNESQLTVQAPTGIGKTMAALFPTLKAMADDHVDKFLYLTARTTGKAAAESSLETLRDRGVRVKSVTLTAKDKICFNPEKACNGEECEFARGFFDRIEAARQELFERDGFNRDAIEEVARRHRVCPFELSLELSLWADGIIGDYNYAFDPAAYLRRVLEDEANRYVFLVDEAHNLVDRAREMYSAELRKQPFLALRRQTRHLPEIFQSLGKINAWLVKWKKKCESASDFVSENDPPEDLYPLLIRFVRATEKWLSAQPAGPSPVRDTILETYFDVHRFLRVGERYKDTYSTCCERVGSDLRLKLFCKDPSTELKEALERSRASVFFSATLTPASYFQNILGCADVVKGLRLPSPFPPEHLCLLVSDQISTLYRRRNETKEVLTRALIEFVKNRQGNYLLYFPSYEYMSTIHALFSVECQELETLVQTPEMTERQREGFLRRFTHAGDGTLVGFAVMGGVFGEGIDLVGDRLSGAAIVGVGLPGISPERELIRDHFSGQGTGFEYAYLYPGINRVLQAAGRVIRSEMDRGVILLIDERFSKSRYRSLLPSEWQPVRVRDDEQLRETLEVFWS